MLSTEIKIFIIGAVLFFIPWYFLYKTNINTLPIQSEDVIPTMFLPVTILKDHTLYLDKYYEMMIDRYPQPDDKDQMLGLTPFYLREVDNHYVSAFPIITSLLSLPIYVIPIVMNLPITWDLLIILNHLSASIILSGSGIVLYKILKKHYKLTEKKSLLLTITYLFGTINFALLSQTLWQHGVLELFVLLTLYFILEHINFQSKENKYLPNLLLAGFFAGTAFLTRPTGMLPIVFLFGLVLLKERFSKTFFVNSFKYILGISIPMLFFFWYNNAFYKSISNQGYSDQLLTSWTGHFPLSFLGVWLSSSKGILTYSPIFIISFIGILIILKKIKSKKITLKNIELENYQYLIYGSIILIQTLIVSFWKHWYGGFSFGYRMSSEIIPFLVLLMIPYVKSKKFNKRLFISLLIFSIFVELFGLVFFDSIWHNAYDKGPNEMGWLWSIKDSELIFNVRRILVKTGLLEQACNKCLPQL